jgi:predicted metal-dependent peptidase
MAYDLENDVYRLLLNESFFAGVSRYISKVPNKNVPTAGVRVLEDGNFEMVYNPDFMEKLSDIHRRGVLKHEFYHLILDHCLGRSPDGRKISRRWNFATDMSINCHLKGELPDNKQEHGFECVFPEKFGYPDFLSAEDYYKRLEEDGKGEGGKCDGNHNSGEGGEGGEPCDGSCGSFDDHNGWGEGNGVPEEVKAVARERLREMMKKAAEEANRNPNSGWGSIPADIRKDIMRFINGTIDWKAVLRMFIGSAVRSSRTSTVKRINKRYPYIHAGKKTNRSAHIAISVDQSGSVSDELLEAFFGELNNLSKLATFTVIPFDTRVEERLIYTWTKGQKRKAERVMCGGTDFDAPTEYVNKNTQFDGHIVLTDMQAPAPKPSRVRRMWMTDMEGSENPYFRNNERIIPIKKNTNV